MTTLAAIRPDSWNFPLLVHVLGAMILVGGMLTASAALFFARGDMRQIRFGYFTLALVAFPGWILMRIGAQWIWSKESNIGFFSVRPRLDDPDWIKVGGTVADLGGGLLMLGLLLGGLALRRPENERSPLFLKATMLISIALLAAYVLAIWAMAGKPG